MIPMGTPFYGGHHNLMCGFGMMNTLVSVKCVRHECIHTYKVFQGMCPKFLKKSEGMYLRATCSVAFPATEDIDAYKQLLQQRS